MTFSAHSVKSCEPSVRSFDHFGGSNAATLDAVLRAGSRVATKCFVVRCCASRAYGSLGLLLLCLAMAFQGVAAVGQYTPTLSTATGLSPTQIYNGGDIDNVSTTNGNLFLQLPLLSYPQKGGLLRLNFNIYYNDKQWFISNLHQVSSAAPYAGVWSWYDTTATSDVPSNVGVYVARDQHLDLGRDTNSQTALGGGNNYSQYVINTESYGYFARSSDGSKHYYGDDNSQTCTQLAGGAICPTTYGGYGNVYPATDGTGYTSTLNGPSRILNQVTGPDGVIYSADTSTNYRESVSDPNGNVITSDANGWTDSVGRLIPGSADGPGTSDNWDYGTELRGADPVPGIPISPGSTTCPTGTTAARVWDVPQPPTVTDPHPYYLCYSQHSYKTAFNLNATLGNTTYNAVTEAQSTASTLVTMLSAIILPNQTSYTFSYDNYLSLTKLTLPAGGSLEYAWQNLAFQQGISIATPITRVVRTRTLNPGNGQASQIWNYSWDLSDRNTAIHVIRDPAFNDTEYQVSGEGLVGIKSYTGCGDHHFATVPAPFICPTTNVLMKTVAFTLSPVGSGGVSTPYTPAFNPSGFYAPTTTTTTMPGASGDVVSQTVTAFTPSYGSCTVWDNYSTGANPTQPTARVVTPCYSITQPQSIASYDYGKAGSGSPGSLLRTVTTNYKYQGGSQNTYLAANLLSLVSSAITTNGSGNKVAETDYGYDETGSPQGALGNQTSIKRWLNHTSGDNPQIDASPVSHTVYNNSGLATMIKDPNGNSTSITYQCAGAYPYIVTNALSQATTYKYDCGTGLLTNVKDPNDSASGNSGTTYTYDAMRSTLSISLSDSGSTQIDYGGYAVPLTITKTVSGTPSPDIKTQVTYDGVGRELQRQTLSAPTSPIILDTTYDPLGRVASVSNPYRSPKGATDPDNSTTSYSYDALGRTLSQCQPDNTPVNQTSCTPNNSYLQWAYTANQMTFADEVGNSWTRKYDGLGRLGAVVEPGSLNTLYSYDALDNLIQVNQLGNQKLVSLGASANASSVRPPRQPGDAARVRTFTYDSLSRLVCAANPESSTGYCPLDNSSAIPSGFMSYAYDANGNLTSRTDPRGVTTTYTPDALNRVLQKTYTIPVVNNLPVASATPSVTYQYDTSPQGGQVNGIGRMTSETVQQGNSVLFQRQVPQYDPMGRVAKELRCVASFCGSYLQDTEYTYDSAGGELTSNTNETLLSYGHDGLGRTTSETIQYVGGSAGTLLYDVQYSPLGGITSANGFESRTYDNRGRTTNINYNSTPLGLNYNATYDYYPNGNLNHEADNVIGPYAYGYDSLNRLTSAVSQDPNVGTQTYTYDNFGNRLSQTGVLAHNATYSDGSNRIDCPGCYDAMGNLLQDVNTAFAPHSYTYDAEGRLSGVSDLGYQYFYDGEGTRVLALQNNAIQRQYFWDALGQYYYVYKADNGWSAMEFYGAGRHIFNFSTADYLPVLNSLGTERSRLGFGDNYGANGYYQNCSSLPFGDGLQCSNQDVSALHFTGKERDTESGLDYFGARYYASNLGRFMVPDPSSLQYAAPTNPQSLNLYSYVTNNPLRFTDPSGMYACTPAPAGANVLGLLGHFLHNTFCNTSDTGANKGAGPKGTSDTGGNTFIVTSRILSAGAAAGGVGHHYMPRMLFENFNDASREFSDRITSGPLVDKTVNYYDQLHIAYNARVANVVSQYLEDTGKTVRELTVSDVTSIVQRMRSAGGSIKEFNTRLITANPGVRTMEQALDHAAQVAAESDAGKAVEEFIEECEMGAPCIPPL